MKEFGSNTRLLLDLEYREQRGFTDCNINNNDISMASWNDIILTGVLFEKNDMRKISMRNGVFSNTGFIESDLKDSDLSFSSLKEVTFNRCNLIKTDLSNSVLYNCNWTGCSAESLILSNSRIIKTHFKMSELYRLKCERSVIVNSGFTIDVNNSFWGLQKASFNNSVLVDCLFQGIEYVPEDFGSTLLINCRFEN